MFNFNRVVLGFKPNRIKNNKTLSWFKYRNKTSFWDSDKNPLYLFKRDLQFYTEVEKEINGNYVIYLLKRICDRLFVVLFTCTILKKKD